MIGPGEEIIIVLICLIVGIIACALCFKGLGMVKTISLLIIMILVLAGHALWFFGTVLPVRVQYQREYGAYINMAYTQATFESIKNEVRVVWAKMNTTFAGDDFDHTYNTLLYWNQNYENSLRAQNNYLSALDDRIDSYIEQYDLLKASAGSSMLADWYDVSINNLRQEMRRDGGLDWVISGAWLIKYYPTVYLVSSYGIDFIILLVSAILWWILLAVSYKGQDERTTQTSNVHTVGRRV